MLSVLKRLDIVFPIIVVSIIVFRAIFSGLILHQYFVSDEIYYGYSGQYIYYKLGLIPSFTPPYTSSNLTSTSGNETVNINLTIDLNTPIGFVNLLGANINWLNTEHPILAKLVYGLLILTLGPVYGRFFLLAVSSIALFLFTREIVRQYKYYSIPPLLLFVALSGTYIHLTYMYFLDTLMITFLLLSVWAHLRNKKTLSMIFSALSIASKEMAILFIIPFIPYYLKSKTTYEKTLPLISIILGLTIGYAPYLLFVPPNTLLNSIRGMTTIKDPFACQALCLFDIKASWALFTIIVPITLWIWLLSPLLIKETEQDIKPLLLTGVITILAYSIIGVSRSIYVFYYAYLEVLEVIPLTQLTQLIHKYCNTKNTRV